MPEQAEPKFPLVKNFTVGYAIHWLMRQGEGKKILGQDKNSVTWCIVVSEGKGKRIGGGDNASGVKENNMFKSTSTGRKEEKRKGRQR